MTKAIIIVLVIAATAAFLIFKMQSNKKLAIENRQGAAEYLDMNKAREGVTVTASGLHYQVLEKGSGEEHPKPSSRVKVHYHGTLTDGTVFDSSVERGQPIDFGLHQVIPGWTEGLQLMVKGEKARLVIPSQLAYGNRSVGSIPPGSVLVFEVELIDFF